MRTTLSLDDDVAKMIEQRRKATDATFKEIVNQALREGLTSMAKPSRRKKLFRTKAVSHGKCYLPNLDDTSEVLAFAEGEWHRETG
jgi:hypothetical protein